MLCSQRFYKFTTRIAATKVDLLTSFCNVIEDFSSFLFFILFFNLFYFIFNFF